MYFLSFFGWNFPHKEWNIPLFHEFDKDLLIKKWIHQKENFANENQKMNPDTVLFSLELHFTVLWNKRKA